MPEIKQKQSSPSPEIEYTEIYFPDDGNLGIGSFITVTKHHAFQKQESILSIVFNPPVFQISVNLNLKNKKILILLGYADGSEPYSQALYLFPENFDTLKSHKFEVRFQDWKIKKFLLDEFLLEEKENITKKTISGATTSLMEELLPPGAPIPEHLGSLVTYKPSRNLPQEIFEKTLDELFDLNKEYCVYKCEQGNTKIKIYRNAKFEFVYYHHNPSFGERELKINFFDIKRKGSQGFFFCITWSHNKNTFYVGARHNNPKFIELRNAIFLTKNKLILLKGILEEFEKILNTSTKEEDAHQFLKNNGKIILGLISIMEPISKFKLGDDFVTDFVINEILEGHILIEIERPNMQLFKKNRQERTQELNHAIEQIESWRTWIAKNHSYISRKLKNLSPNPVCWVVAGRRKDLSEEDKIRLKEINQEYRSSYKIFTYDDLIDRVKCVIENLSN